MPGILNQTLHTTSFGITTTKDLRNTLLGRNLPPPVTNTLIEGGLQSYLPDPHNRTVIDVPIFGTQDENIPVHYDPNEQLFPVGEFLRDTQNVNFNTYKPLNDNYIPFNVIVPPHLGYPLPAWGGALTVGPYPISYNSDRFDLINKGDKVGVRYPYPLLEHYGSLTFAKETPLGLRGGESLQSAISEKVSQIEEESNPDTPSTGSITVDPNINIVDNFINQMTGSELFYNSLPNGAVGWQEFNSNNKGDLSKVDDSLGGYIEPTLTTESRVNELLTRTSNTQIGFLFTLLDKNLYVPTYEDRRNVGTSLEGTNSRYYIGSEKTTNRGATITQVFQSSDLNGAASEDPLDVVQSTTVDDSFFWRTGNQNPFNEKSILSKTQKLVDDHPNGVWINQTKKYFKDKVENKLISRGSAMSRLSLIEAESNGNFCRVWTVTDQYNYLNAIRNTGLFTSDDVSKPGFSVTSTNASLSVLSDNGFVKTHPTKEDSTTTFKKFMLSLENLAWNDNLADLPMSEIGPGDILSNTKGRIMWFPPYDLGFDENVSANWTKNDFIGRGEPVFTYNNTTRSGQLKFKVLVDHPRVINGYRGYRTDTIEKFFAGCITPNQFLDYLDKNTDISRNTQEEIKKKLNKKKSQKVSNTQKVTEKMTVYFASDSAELFYADAKYTTRGFPSGDLKDIKKLVAELGDTNSKVLITLEGYANKQEQEANPSISKDRAKFVWEQLKEQVGSKNIKKIIKGYGDSQATSGKEVETDSGIKLLVSNPIDLRVDVLVENDSKDSDDTKHKKEELEDFITPDQIQMIDNLIINENGYFDFVDANYPNYFQTISEKIKYFHAGFHSTTPEGLNTRLTFLQQCMRQGPSIYDDLGSDLQPQNLAFGRPPVCILRIGDFFHTKIIINSLSISYAGGSAIQWDLNPSGIGVQPMMADVTMAIDLIGGHSLLNPINRLQNALSFNYYANTEMYDPRAESVSKSTGAIVPGLSLGNVKKEIFDDDKVEAFYADLKDDGIINQSLDAKNADSGKEEESVGGIDYQVSGFDVTVKSDKPPSEVPLNGEPNKDNLMEVEISVEKNLMGFTTNMPKKTTNEDSATFNKSTYDPDNDLIDTGGKSSLANLEKELQTYENQLVIQENHLKNGTYSNINTTTKKIKELNRDIKSKEKEIDKEKNKKGAKVKVVAYYTKDKKNSRKETIYTLTSQGLVPPST